MSSKRKYYTVPVTITKKGFIFVSLNEHESIEKYLENCKITEKDLVLDFTTIPEINMKGIILNEKDYPDVNQEIDLILISLKNELNSIKVGLKMWSSVFNEFPEKVLYKEKVYKFKFRELSIAEYNTAIYELEII